MSRIAARAQEIAMNALRKVGGKSDCNSFMPGTKVLLADGSSKPIEELEVGEEVLAADEKTGEPSARNIVAAITGTGVKDLVEIGIDGGGAVTATGKHPFWVPDQKSWVDAEDLQIGSVLQTSDENLLRVSEVRKWTAFERVYNLTVDNVHAYYVLAGVTPILVHNASPVCSIFAVDSSGAATALPVHEIDSQLYPGVADNFNNAVGNGESPIVTRLTGRSAIRANRNAAQAGQPRPGTLTTGMSWEEFPFASTAEGGSGATLRLIPRNENVAHGRDSLWPFLRDNGIAGGDKYYVRVR